MQTSYPVFESGQVLTSKHLNDLVEFLEQPDRLTRNKLIGIGIVCGLEVGYEPAQSRVVIGAGGARFLARLPARPGADRADPDAALHGAGAG